MILIAILGTAWLVVLGAIAALCRGARRGDEMRAAATAEDQRRRHLSAGVVRVDLTAAEMIGIQAAGDPGSREPERAPALELLGSR
ncbi:MAG TPA: hypothetical protein VHT27_04440 [Solirubrobacteraceae bacterium]|jgi:hypothetical protein|nr:hypothetical protein [Solirubrobacteraceae bacterium]